MGSLHCLHNPMLVPQSLHVAPVIHIVSSSWSKFDQLLVPAYKTYLLEPLSCPSLCVAVIKPGVCD